VLPSSTVENYLKAILKAQSAEIAPDALVPMGQLASALGVAPGTATTMVKTLAESGLVRYEPYSGVRLTRPGEKLAALVLRRHRLIELFLVRVLGMSWTEVHDEAENLEHAVSERLIDRIDEMLGRPAVDPHGDPIPDQDGTVSRARYDTLLTCPLHTAMTVQRVSDQDPEFLRFVERHELKPGQVIEVEARDDAADSVQLRGGNHRTFTIGARAASKVLVQAAQVMAFVLMLALPAIGQTPAAPAPMPPPQSPEAESPFKIADNSFLVEEAFNQEAGIFQNIFGATRLNGAWAATFTQEWPVVSQTHQFSYTVLFLDGRSAYGFGDMLLNYRFQALTEGPGRPAFSPRVSLVLPTGSVDNERGDGSYGLQVNLPFSKRRDRVYWHWNGGFTWLPRAEAPRLAVGGPTDHADLLSPFVAGSAIYALHPMFQLMLENVVLFERVFDGTTRSRETVYTVSPGFRGGWNVGDAQIVAGAAVPIVWADDKTDAGLFLYFSYELPFQKK
jgi:DtxR family transcriptional regulator, Mn-dependent transcriptional regulator